MADIEIYDSQGNSLDNPVDSPDEEIKDYFFNRVRFAYDESRRDIELVVFFRGRESEASRAEQYYARLKFANRDNIGSFQKNLQDYVKQNHGIIIDISTEDMDLYKFNPSESSPGSKEDREDLVELAKSGHSPTKVGVGTYESAVSLIRMALLESVESIVVTEEADSTVLLDYDLIIEKGGYNGLVFIGNTEEEIKELKKSQRQEMAIDPGHRGTNSRKSKSNNQNRAAQRAIIGIFGGLILLGVIIYPTCVFLGFDIPLIGSPLGIDRCGPPAHSFDNATGTITDSNTIEMQGQLLASGKNYKRGKPEVEISVRLESLNGEVITLGDLISSTPEERKYLNTSKGFILTSKYRLIDLNDGKFNISIQLDEDRRLPFNVKYYPSNHTVVADNRHDIKSYQIELNWMGTSEQMSIEAEKTETSTRTQAEATSTRTETPTMTQTPEGTPTVTAADTPTESA